MNQKRPVNLDLTSMKFPVMAIVSILHRVSGVILFFLFPLVLYCLQYSLQSALAFDALSDFLASPLMRLLLWLFSAALAYHFFAGLRHLLMDLGYGESLEAGRRSAILVLVLSVIATLLLGIWIWSLISPV